MRLVYLFACLFWLILMPIFALANISADIKTKHQAHFLMRRDNTVNTSQNKKKNTQVNALQDTIQLGFNGEQD